MCPCKSEGKVPKPRQGWPVYSPGAAIPVLLFVFQRRESGAGVELPARRWSGLDNDLKRTAKAISGETVTRLKPQE